MKIAYTILGLYNSGGMEKILLQKANYLADVYGHDVTIITTDQDKRPVFFYKSPKVKQIDLGINYYKKKGTRWWHFYKLRLKREHQRILTQVLEENKFDICITLMDFDFDFITKINDGSKKIAEYHFSRYAKVLSSNNYFKKWLQFMRTIVWKRKLQKFSRFVVLTEKDKEQWGNIKNITVIPNFISSFSATISDTRRKRIISVGRSDYQKGFDLLLRAWKLVQDKLTDWELTIFGGGDKTTLFNQIEKEELHRVSLEQPTSNIGDEYIKSGFYVLSSRYEGLPMVLLEAISYGLPIVSFDCPCGPSDIITHKCGILVKPGDVVGLASAIENMAMDSQKRLRASTEAIKQSVNFSADVIMEKWQELFCSIIKKP